jgi:vacuolar-type H+-ATPase subunit I/STV1
MDIPMLKPVTKSELNETLRRALKETTREIISHFNASQGVQNRHLGKIDQRLDSIDSRLEGLTSEVHDMGDDVAKIKLAVVDLMGTDRHMHNLVRELKGQNIKLDEARIFSM